MKSHRRLVSAVAMALLVAACTSGTPGSRSSTNKGAPGSRFTVTVRGETPWFDPATATTLLLPAGGLVTAAGGIACGIAAGVASTRCAAEYAWGSADAPATVAFSAIPDADSGFAYVAFAGACTGSGPCVVSGNADTFLAVRFARTREGLGAHANFSAPSVHGPEYRSFLAGAPGSLACTSCHGPDLLGRANAVSCAACHAWPLPPPALPALVWDAGSWDGSTWQ